MSRPPSAGPATVEVRVVGITGDVGPRYHEISVPRERIGIVVVLIAAATRVVGVIDKPIEVVVAASEH